MGRGGIEIGSIGIGMETGNIRIGIGRDQGLGRGGGTSQGKGGEKGREIDIEMIENTETDPKIVIGQNTE